MAGSLVSIITAQDPAVRDRALEDFCSSASLTELLAECAELDAFRRQCDNLYERVRALFFLYAIHRFHLPLKQGLSDRGMIPFHGYEHLLNRRFEESIDTFLAIQAAEGPGDSISSALAAAYHRLAFQTLADQVRRSVRSVKGNQWMFRMSHPLHQPLRLRPALLERNPSDGTYPILREQTPVRMDLTHSAWSDIFFLGMDFPDGAKVLNISVDLGMHGRDAAPEPPVAAFLRVIEEPVLRLTSVDLGASADISDLAEVFDFARDYLGLLKAAVISSGIVPPGIEGSGQQLSDLLARIAGPGKGLELVSSVRGIPKGSRLAVSTNLLAALISACMRATGQTASLTGQLEESERRVVLARAILDEITSALHDGDVRAIGTATTRNFTGPIQTIIPWASTYYTEQLIERTRAAFGEDFLGFWMLGGMSGGGMGFMVSPHRKAEAQQKLQEIMSGLKKELASALPFAMEPVVYDFAINENGTFATLLSGDSALMPEGYYVLTVPRLLRQEIRSLSLLRRAELDRLGAACRSRPELSGMVQSLFDVMLPRRRSDDSRGTSGLLAMLDANGFDRAQHEQIRSDLRDARIGLAQNRLPASATVEDVRPEDVARFDLAPPSPECIALGEAALARGEAAVITLAGGAGSRWTQGAGVCKALHPFCKFDGRHRTFLEVHLAKSRRRSRLAGTTIPHLFTTSYLTHQPTADFLARHQNYGYSGDVILSQGRSIGLRMVPTVRDLRFAWEEMPQQVLDQQQQKVRDSLRSALIRWATEAGEASDYTDNLPLQCLHPTGHWYEFPNLLRNGELAALVRKRPQLQYLLLHNVDTLGADLDPGILGWHIQSEACLSFEVITRRLEDRGGGLARVNGRPRLVEGLAMAREEDEFRLSFYNSMTTWIHLDKLLAVFGLVRADLEDKEKVTQAVRNLAARMPAYITLKDVKKRWGHGQEDIFPVIQFEKLWGDMSALPDVVCRFPVVPRSRGQQLKDQSQLDGWLRDGSAAAVASLCEW